MDWAGLMGVAFRSRIVAKMDWDDGVGGGVTRQVLGATNWGDGGVLGDVERDLDICRKASCIVSFVKSC
jgi:hypothetical protein